MEAGREFQFLEVMGTNVLAIEVVRHFSNLTAKVSCESAKRVNRVNRRKYYIFKVLIET